MKCRGWQCRAAAGIVKPARTQYRSAFEVVQEVASGLTDPVFKAGFMESQTVQRIFAQADTG